MAEVDLVALVEGSGEKAAAAIVAVASAVVVTAAETTAMAEG